MRCVIKSKDYFSVVFFYYRKQEENRKLKEKSLPQSNFLYFEDKLVGSIWRINDRLIFVFL